VRARAQSSVVVEQSLPIVRRTKTVLTLFRTVHYAYTYVMLINKTITFESRRVTISVSQTTPLASATGTINRTRYTFSGTRKPSPEITGTRRVRGRVRSGNGHFGANVRTKDDSIRSPKKGVFERLFIIFGRTNESIDIHVRFIGRLFVFCLFYLPIESSYFKCKMFGD